MRIGLYVHHHGAGHRTRAAVLARALTGLGADVTGLSSLSRPAGWPGPWVVLPRDDDGPDGFTDPTAGGRLHWAPLGHPGYRRRMEAVAAACSRLDLLLTDVSCEVAALARLAGVPVAVAAMRGRRCDETHRLAYDLATVLLAPWPAALPEPGWPQHWLRKTVHVGGLSRFDGAERAGRDGADDGPVRVSVLMGAGGGAMAETDLADARAATPSWTWERAGADRDVAQSLAAADVVVTHAGQNAVAEVAAFRRPAVVVALPRPHAEQEATAAALDEGRIAVTVAGVPAAGRWPGLVARARALGGGGWARWSDGRGAARAAETLMAVAGGRRFAGGTAVVTLARGRHRHLRGLVAGLAAGSTLPERLVVVAMGDPDVDATARAACRGTGLVPDVVPIDVGPDGRLPLAAARNLGARTAEALGCDRLVFLDVDCIPGEHLVSRYHDVMCAAEDEQAAGEGARPMLWAGSVTYLPPRPAGEADGPAYDVRGLEAMRAPHPARPDPPSGEVLAGDDVRLFWSLSFAAIAADLRRLGGFDERYTGYGGEDTDLAMRLQEGGGRLTWVGGADAYHQHHPTQDPPVQHLVDVVANANRFADRWGWHPMEGWLRSFAALGLARQDAATGRWVVAADPAPATTAVER